MGQVKRNPTQRIDSSERVPKKQGSTITGDVKTKCKDMHKVQRKETIFSVSRQNGISEQELYAANPELKDGMKRGQYLCIPYPNAGQISVTQGTSSLIPPTNNELFSANQERAQKYNTVKAALLLPFVQDKRMVEYYEGFLLAVDSLKRTGPPPTRYADHGKDNESS